MYSSSAPRTPSAEPAAPGQQATLSLLALRCPPLPQTLLEAARLVDTPEKLEVGPVTQMAERDPFVVTHLLFMVNSAYYGLRRSVSSVERAVVMLGPVAVTGLVLGLSMLRLRSAFEGAAAAAMHRLFRHSLASAYLARELYERLAPGSALFKEAGTVFTAGLLHDFGKVVLAYSLPERAAPFYDGRATEQLADPDLRPVERLLFGLDHVEAGEYVARKLSLPEALIDVIRQHHAADVAPATTAPSSLVLPCVILANDAAKAMGYPAEREAGWATAMATVRRLGLPTSLLDHLAAQRTHVDSLVATMDAAVPPRRGA